MTTIKLHNKITRFDQYKNVKILEITGRSNITVTDLLKMTLLEELYIELPKSMSFKEATKLIDIRVQDKWPNMEKFGMIDDGNIHIWTKK